MRTISVHWRLRHAATPEPPEGLYLGSATSPIVGEKLIARLLEAAQLPSVITYADNLLVPGRSEGEVVARIQALREVLDDPPLRCVSGLSVREGAIHDVANRNRPLNIGIEFSSHVSVFDDGPDQASIVGWSPSRQRLDQIEIGDREHVSVDQLDKAINKVSNWRRYYKDWPDGDLEESRRLAPLKVRKYLLKRTPQNRADAIAAVVDAFMISRSYGLSDEGFQAFMLGNYSQAEVRLAEDIEARLIDLLQNEEEPNNC